MTSRTIPDSPATAKSAYVALMAAADRLMRDFDVPPFAVATAALGVATALLSDRRVADPGLARQVLMQAAELVEGDPGQAGDTRPH